MGLCDITGVGHSLACSLKNRSGKAAENAKKACAAQFGGLLGLGVEALTFLKISLNMHQFGGRDNHQVRL